MNPRPVLTIIAAVSADGFISKGKGVPWNLPRDKERFRRATDGQWLLIGRRTFEEMLGWFRDHHPLVLSRDETYVPPVGTRVASLEKALQTASRQGARELFVCGGSGAYFAAMPWADRLVLTHVDVILGGGVPFPVIRAEEWHIGSRQEYPADVNNPFALVFADYERRPGPKPA